LNERANKNQKSGYGHLIDLLAQAKDAEGLKSLQRLSTLSVEQANPHSNRYKIPLIVDTLFFGAGVGVTAVLGDAVLGLSSLAPQVNFFLSSSLACLFYYLDKIHKPVTSVSMLKSDNKHGVLSLAEYARKSIDSLEVFSNADPS
jgi:hypothetical protein